MAWFNVELDGGAHGVELHYDDPPIVGQERDLGGVLARIEEVTTGEDGKPLIVASRLVPPLAQ